MLTTSRESHARVPAEGRASVGLSVSAAVDTSGLSLSGKGGVVSVLVMFMAVLMILI